MKKINIFGRQISAVVLGLTLMAALASAGLLSYYGMVTGTAQVNQSVTLDGNQCIGGDYSECTVEGAWNTSFVAGNNIIELHTLKNNAEVPATIGFSTTCAVPGYTRGPTTETDITWAGACDGITTAYQEWNTPTNAITGVRPTVIYDNGIYKMWYKTSETPDPNFIHYAHSSDGTSWAGSDTDVAGTNNCPFVIKEDGVYYMVNYNAGGDQDFYIYTSSNGINWTEKGRIFTNPKLNNGNDSKIDNPKLLKTDTGYNLYFQEGSNNKTAHPYYYIELATTNKTSLSDIADDSSETEFISQGIVLSPGTTGAWDDFRLMHPMVIKEGNQYIMMYVGYSVADISQKIGYAVSDNGVSWTKVDVSTSGYDTTLGTGSAKPSLVNANGDIVLFYMNENIDKTTLTPVVLDASNKMTLQPGEAKGFFVENKFNVALIPDSYTITTKVIPQ